MLKIVSFLVIAATFSGCSFTPKRMQCASWRDQGLIYSTVESCEKCIDAVGRNVDAVRGCAMGMDAATLMIPDRR